MSKIDWLILTAANRAQARGYTAQLKERALPVCRWRVIPDPGGRRAGSGGSTLWVLFELARTLLKRRPRARSLSALFEGQRILIIHSGGDSRRLCAYAAQGKIFLPLPCNTDEGGPATLFDLILKSLAGLPSPPNGHVLIASGDVLLTFDNDEVDFTAPGVTGVAYPGPLDRGGRHGVYVAARDGRVLDFLQKPDRRTALERGAVDSVGRVLVDTGLISLDTAATARLLRAAGVSLRRGRLVKGAGIVQRISRGRSPSLDLYEHFVMAMAPAIDRSAYLTRLGRGAGAGEGPLLSNLYDGLHGLSYRVNVLPYCEFFHVGSTAELLANIGTLNRTAKSVGFTNYCRSSVSDRSSLEGAFVYNSVLDSSRVNAEDGVLLESVEVTGDVELAGRNVVVGWPGHARSSLRLAEGWGVVCLPVRRAVKRGGGKNRDVWTAVLFGVDDDFKTAVNKGATFGNRSMAAFLERHGIDPGRLWPGLPVHRRTLWEARLWPVGHIDHVLSLIRWMLEDIPATIPGAAASSLDYQRTKRPRGDCPRPFRHYLQTLRLSLAQLLPRIDHDRLFAHRARISRLAQLRNLGSTLRANPWLPASHVLSLIDDKPAAAAAMDRIDPLLKSDSALEQARLFKLAHLINQRFAVSLPSHPGLRGPGLESAAFGAVARSVAQRTEMPGCPRPAAILPDQVVWVTCPARIDFAGGWSDTPPICTELGGAVLNAAVTLNGQYPIQVMAKLSDRPAITLNSLDLGQRVVITRTPAPAEYRDPRHWSALPMAALVLAGLCPADPQRALKRWLDRLGGGLDITIFSALPKGSGLGTSSILGAAMLACLARVIGEQQNLEPLIGRTSALEQLMTTAGGWQDQVGGITPGVKLIRTVPGPEQNPGIHWTVFDLSPGGELRSRLLLYYTGYKRMARNILQKVVGRYLSRDAEAIRIIQQLKEGAEQMKNDLATGDVEAFARGVELYWNLKKQLDPGSTNEKIEALLRPLDRYLSARLLAGAGGGGFVLMVARDADSARQVRKALAQHPPNPLARFFQFDIDPKGLSLTVL